MKEETKKHYGITITPKYIRGEFVARIRYDKLRLQAAVRGAYEAQESLRHEYHELQEKIEEIVTGGKVGPYELRSVSEKKRREFVAKYLRECRKTERQLRVEASHRLEKVAALQKRQKEIIQEIRKINAEKIRQQKKDAAEVRKAEKIALAEGRFWRCSEETLKKYFHVPFKRKKLVDVSEKFRAALFVELTYEPGEGLVPTDTAYLCGIDDNHEEWGHIVRLPFPWKRWEYESKVEDAMAVIWGVEETIIQKSVRQGEIIFFAESFPSGKTMNPMREWRIAPSHCVTSPSLRGSDTYIYSDDPIVVVHPTHRTLVLPPGEYRFAVHMKTD